MKKIIYYPYLFAVFPILMIYIRNVTATQFEDILGLLIIFVLLTFLLVWFFRRLTGDPRWAALIATMIVFFFSSSVHLYQIVRGYIWHNTWKYTHLVIIGFELALVIFIGSKRVWDKVFTTKRIQTLTAYLNVVGLMMMVLPFIINGPLLYTILDDAPRPWTDYIGKEDTPQTFRNDNPPDIYYIILDGYGRGDILKDIFLYDNSDFTDFLQERGFYIASQGRSNYSQTPLSLAASLNFDYVNFSETLAGKQSINFVPLFDLVYHNRVLALLKQNGYRFISIDSGSSFTRFTDADVFISPYVVNMSPLARWFLSTTALDALYEPGFSFTPFLRHYLPLAGYDTHRQYILFALDQLSVIPEIAGPKFVFVHIVAPHPPFVLDQYGQPITPDYQYMTGDGVNFPGSAEEYRQGYVNQLAYLDSRVKSIVEAILKQSSQSPVIIIQGDHGPALLDEHASADSRYTVRMSILNAYHFPDGKETALYPTITPVNTFRLIFNLYFGTRYKLLPDCSYHSPYAPVHYPYDFTNVSENNEACQEP